MRRANVLSTVALSASAVARALAGTANGVAARTRSYPWKAHSGLVLRRLQGLLGGGGAARQSLVALALNSTTSLAAGAFLSSIAGTFEALPGLLVIVPAAIGLRGNIFSTFGSRLGTAIRLGTFELTPRHDSVLGQNVIAAVVLTLSMSALLAVLGKGVAVAVGVANTISVLDLALISVLGGVLASVAVLIATVGLAAATVRFGWDLDNVSAPLVSTLGDVLTLPSLWLATFVVGAKPLETVLAAGVFAASMAALAWGLQCRLPLTRRIVRESAPILMLAVCLSILAGIVLQQRLEVFSAYPALLVLVPAFISSAGALGGVLSGRLASNLHLGLATAAAFPGRDARRDGLLILTLAVPVLLFNGIGAHLVGRLLHQPSPGLSLMVTASLLGGALAVSFVVVLAYYSTVGAYALRLDPDTYGVPIVTSAVDFVGVLALVAAILTLTIV